MDFVEYGELPDPNTKKGLEKMHEEYSNAKSLAQEGNLDDIEASIYIRHYSALNSIASDHAKPMPSLPFIDAEWHYGPTGCGKSRRVRESNPDAYIKDVTKWWDGYRGQSVVILEDIDVYNVKLGRDLKIWTDHYGFPAEQKNKGIIQRTFSSAWRVIDTNFCRQERH